jgi:hypothetical protein
MRLEDGRLELVPRRQGPGEADLVALLAPDDVVIEEDDRLHAELRAAHFQRR